jgi:DNA gyrase subunit A
LSDSQQQGYVVMASAKGKIKKTATEEFSRPRSSGLIALTIDPDDELISVNLTSGNDHILLATAKGKAIRFHEEQVRSMGRQARGVTGIRLQDDDVVIGMEVITDGSGTLLTITQSGFGEESRRYGGDHHKEHP